MWPRIREIIVVLALVAAILSMILVMAELQKEARVLHHETSGSGP